MSDQPQPPQQAMLQVQVPDDLQAGVYCNIVAVWHTSYEFTLDFAVMMPMEQMDRPDGTTGPVVPARVVSRVKVPTTQLFALIQALNENMTRYEKNFGPISQIGPDGPLFPPSAEDES